MLDGMSDSIQGSRIENLQSREVDRQSPTGLIFLVINFYSLSRFYHASTATRLFTFPRTTSRDHVRHHFPEAKETKLHSMNEGQNLHANERTIKQISKQSHKNSVFLICHSVATDAFPSTFVLGHL